MPSSLFKTIKPKGSRRSSHGRHPLLFYIPQKITVKKVAKSVTIRHFRIQSRRCLWRCGFPSWQVRHAFITGIKKKYGFGSYCSQHVSWNSVSFFTSRSGGTHETHHADLMNLFAYLAVRKIS